VKGIKQSKIGISHSNTNASFGAMDHPFLCKISPKGSLQGLVGKSVKHQTKNHVKPCLKLYSYINCSLLKQSKQICSLICDSTLVYCV
jgi:hypothetical protein